MNIKVIAGALAAVVVIAAAMSAFVVDETEQVVITRFSKVIRTVQKPGLHFKVPFLDSTITYPNNLQEWDGDPGEIPTKDRTYIYVDTFARWKIVKPVLFFRTIGANTQRATSRLNEIIDPAVRNLITSNRLTEAVRNSNRILDKPKEADIENDQKTDEKASKDDKAPKSEESITDKIEDVLTKAKYERITIGREKIDKLILEQAAPKMKNFGIMLVDLKLKQINFREDVRTSIYDRMIAERKQIAQKFRSEGQGKAREILGDKEFELKQIRSEAYRKSQEIKGRADAEATKLYAEAFGKDPEFYSFIKTLEIYNTALDKDSSLILSTDSDLLKYLKGYSLDK